jgi:hypothetical protein
MSLQFRRGLASDLTTITPASGEPIWTTDTNVLVVGDGVTMGGIPVGSGGTSYDQSLNTFNDVTFHNVTSTGSFLIANPQGDGYVPAKFHWADNDTIGLGNGNFDLIQFYQYNVFIPGNTGAGMIQLGGSSVYTGGVYLTANNAGKLVLTSNGDSQVYMATMDATSSTFHTPVYLPEQNDLGNNTSGLFFGTGTCAIFGYSGDSGAYHDINIYGSHGIQLNPGNGPVWVQGGQGFQVDTINVNNATHISITSPVTFSQTATVQSIVFPDLSEQTTAYIPGSAGFELNSGTSLLSVNQQGYVRLDNPTPGGNNQGIPWQEGQEYGYAIGNIFNDGGTNILGLNTGSYVSLYSADFDNFMYVADNYWQTPGPSNHGAGVGVWDVQNSRYRQWTFFNDGGLGLPDNSRQYTAFLGNQELYTTSSVNFGNLTIADDGVIYASQGAYSAPDGSFTPVRIGLYGNQPEYAIGVETSHSWIQGSTGVKLYSGDNVERFRATSDGVTINNAYTLPTADGSAGQYIKTNGDGTLSWDTATASGSATTSTLYSVNNGYTATLDDSGLLNVPGITIINNSGTAITFSDGSQQTIAWTGTVAYSNVTGTPAVGQTSVYTRSTLPAGVEGLLITISDSGDDTNSPSGNDALAYWNSTAVEWQYVANSNTVIVPSAAFTPASLSGLVAWYNVGSISGATWTDLSGNNNNGTIAYATVESTSGNGASNLTAALTGGSSGVVTFPDNLLNPGGYTLFHVTRRMNVAYGGRIMSTTPSENWISGHYDHLAGVAFHNGWLTDTMDHYADAWLISTDQQFFYRPNGNVALQGSGGGGLIPTTLGINLNQPCPGWQSAEIIIYNRELNGTEIGQIESYLATTYGITLGV